MVVAMNFSKHRAVIGGALCSPRCFNSFCCQVYEPAPVAAKLQVQSQKYARVTGDCPFAMLTGPHQ